MKFIFCNGSLENGTSCDREYAIISRVIARKRVEIFYATDWNNLPVGNPLTYCKRCGKSLKAQIPLEVEWT